MIGSIDKAYFRHGLVKVYQRWLSYFAFEGRQITARGRWLNLFVFGWLRLLAAWPGSPRARSPIFITGLGRSGTTILGILLSLHRDVGHLSEPKALWHVIDPRQDINSNFSTTGGRYRLGAGDASPAIARRAHRLYARYLGLARARRVVDKYPEMIFRVGYLRALFPDAKFIFIVRSGTDAVASVVNWSEKWGSVSSQGQRDWWGRNDIKWHYLRDQVLRRDPAYASVAACLDGEVDHANRAALEWVVTMREGLAQERLHPDAVVRITYERLTEHPVEELRRLQSACGLVPDPAVEDYAQGRLYENPLKTFPELIPEVADLFRRTMLEMGYT